MTFKRNKTEIKTPNKFSKAAQSLGPDSWASVPEIAGHDYKANAKIQQRLNDRPLEASKIMDHIIHNEMEDHPEGNDNFLGYCNDN